MPKSSSLFVVALVFALPLGPAAAQSSISQLMSGAAVQFNLLSVATTGATGGAMAGGGQTNLNTLNAFGAGMSPVIITSPSFFLNQGVQSGVPGLSSIQQNSINEIQAVSSGLGGLALAALTGPQTALNSVNVANIVLASGSPSSIMQSLDLTAPSAITSTNLLSANSAAGRASLLGNGNIQNSSVAINSIVLSLPLNAQVLLGQSGPTAPITIVSGNSAIAVGQTGASIGGR
jgi:hypothetical protein